MGRRLKVFTWHVHGSYLWYLSHIPHDLFVPVRPGRPEGYAGRTGTLPWPPSVHEVPADAVRDLPVDVILFQSHRNWLDDQHEILSAQQRRLPRIYLEHDPPRQSPTDTRHPVDDPDVVIVHVTHFNRLMWDSGPNRTAVIEHGVILPEGVTYTGEIPRGIVAVNHLARRGRRLGADVFERARQDVPLDLVGMGAEELGGIGEIPPPGLAAFAARYRFMFNPIRYTSLGLAVCEAMAAGVPIVALATTEMVTAIENGMSGWVDTDVDRLIEKMGSLLDDPLEAHRLGQGARRTAERRFSIGRFSVDWDRVLRATVSRPSLFFSTTSRAQGSHGALRTTGPVLRPSSRPGRRP